MRTIFIAMGEIAVKKGGITRVLLDRATMFARSGYRVKILLLNWDPNMDSSVQELQKLGRIDPRVEFIDAHDYFISNESEQGDSLTQKRYGQEEKLFEPEYKIDLSAYEEELKANYLTNDNTLVKIKKWKKDASEALALDWILQPENNESYSVSYPYDDNKKVCSVHFNAASNCITHQTFIGPDGNVRIVKTNNSGYRAVLFRKQGERIELATDNDCWAYLIEYACKQEDEKPILIIEGFNWEGPASLVSPDVAYVILASHFSHLEPPLESDRVHYHNAFTHWYKYAALVVLTEEQKRDILEEYPDIKNLHVIPNCIPASRVTENINTVEKDKSKVVCVTRISREKNIQDLIYAFKEVVGQKEDAILEIYGEGKDKERLTRIVQRLGLQENVFFMGYALDVNKVYQSALASVLTSKSEGHPLGILESMVNGVPVISYDCKYGPKEIIKDGVNGFLIETGNIRMLMQKLLYALVHPKEIDAMGVYAKTDAIEKFNEARHLKSWANLAEIIDEDDKINSCAAKQSLVKAHSNHAN